MSMSWSRAVYITRTTKGWHHSQEEPVPLLYGTHPFLPSRNRHLAKENNRKKKECTQPSECLFHHVLLFCSFLWPGLAHRPPKSIRRTSSKGESGSKRLCPTLMGICYKKLARGGDKKKWVRTHHVRRTVVAEPIGLKCCGTHRCASRLEY